LKRLIRLLLAVFLLTSCSLGLAKNKSTDGKKSLLADVRVRRAIAYAIDMNAIVKGLFKGKAIAANSLTPNGDWKTNGLNNYFYNPAKAKALLKEAGWDKNYVLDVVYYYSDQLTVDLMVTIQSYLADVGMKMKFRKVEGDLAKQLWAPPDDPVKGPANVDWDLAYAAIGALSNHEFYNRLGAPDNSHTPTDPVLNKLIDGINATIDIDKQKKAFYKLQKYENSQLIAIPLYYQQLFIFESSRVHRKGNPYGDDQYAYDWRFIDWDINTAKNGERVLYSDDGPTQFFETVFVNPASNIVKKVLFDRLIVADENLNPKKGQLASNYKVSKGGLTIEFTLRDGLTWHDGTPLTADDVRFTVEYSAKIPTLNAVAANTYSSLEGYREYVDGKAGKISGIVINGNKIAFKFKKLDPNALLTFSQWPPLPKHLLEKTDPLQPQQSAYWQAPVGSGPFKIEKVVMNNYVTLVPYKGYWDKGTGNIQKIMLSPDKKNRVVNAEMGKIDYAFGKSTDEADSIGKMNGMKVHQVNTRYTRFFYVNKFEKK
jgi:peptide/nickel transport system substrate-binding protein